MHRVSRAFTLVELLVTIGIIAVLVGLIIVSAKGVRLSAHRTESLSALRQMMTGYTAYAADYDQRLLPGYIAPEDFDPAGGPPGAFADLDHRILLPDQYRFQFNTPADRLDAGSYVWRLAPYVDGRWETFYADYGNPALISRLNQELGGQSLAATDGDEIYGRGSRDPDPMFGDVGIGYAPSFGLNCMYLGGDSLHGRAEIASANPWTSPRSAFAASRLSQVKYPSKVITFGACVQGNADLRPADLSSSEIQFGCAELRPPLIARNDPQNRIDPVAANWTTDGVRFKEWGFLPGMEGPQVLEVEDFALGGGLPIGRWGADYIPTATLDGATGIQNPIDMSTDISRWHWDFTIVVSSGGGP